MNCNTTDAPLQIWLETNFPYEQTPSQMVSFLAQKWNAVLVGSLFKVLHSIQALARRFWRRCTAGFQNLGRGCAHTAFHSSHSQVILEAMSGWIPNSLEEPVHTLFHSSLPGDSGDMHISEWQSNYWSLSLLLRLVSRIGD